MDTKISVQRQVVDRDTLKPLHEDVTDTYGAADIAADKELADFIAQAEPLFDRLSLAKRDQK
jgi:hypothetical protein